MGSSGRFAGVGGYLLELATFRRMIAPALLQIMFWPAALASIYYSGRLILRGNAIGWIPLIVGTLFVRVLFEAMILFFRIFDELSEIRRALESEQLR